MEVEERLLKYISIKTPCDENSDKVPTTSCQFNLAKILADELKDLGLTKVILDDKCFVYGILPATPGYETRKKLGFIAHMDTVQEFCEGEIHPVCTPDYNGEDLVLGDSGRILTTKDFPHLKALKGRTLITSDGNTILGVDDKAGIAEIMQLLEILQTEQIPHGQISVAFTRMKNAEAVLLISILKLLMLKLPIQWTEMEKARSNTRISMPVKQNLKSTGRMFIPDLQKMS